MSGASAGHGFAVGEPPFDALDGAEVVNAAIQPVDDHLGGTHRHADRVQVFKRIDQRIVSVKDGSAVRAAPPTVLLLDRTEEPGHR